mgnify:CR=1 FL=1
MQTYTYNDIMVGMKKSVVYTISEDIVARFIETFGDVSPVHIDDAYAREYGFKSSIAHGAILNGFLSHFVGVEFPGKHALLQSVKMQYKAPNYIGDAVTLEAEVVQKVDAVRVIVMNIRITNKTQNCLSATAVAQVGMRE